MTWAHGRLLGRSEARRILVVVSDGTPMDEATLAANGYEYLDQHLKTVVENIERSSPVQLAAIGIGHDVSTIYSNATTHRPHRPARARAHRKADRAPRRHGPVVRRAPPRGALNHATRGHAATKCGRS